MKSDINRKYQEEIYYKLAQLPNKLNSAEREWIDVKDIIQGTAYNMVIIIIIINNNLFCIA